MPASNDAKNVIRARFQLVYPDFDLDVDLQLPASGVSALFGPSGLSLIHISEPTRPY